MGDLGHHGFFVKRTPNLDKSSDNFFEIFFIGEDDKAELIYFHAPREDVICFLEGMIDKIKKTVEELKDE